MKKLLYLCLAVAFIFTACSKDEDNQPPVSTPSIVGVWTPTSMLVDYSYTYYQNGILIDSETESDYFDSNDPDWEPSTIEFTADGDMKEDGDLIGTNGTYTYSNNTLTMNEDGETTTMTSCTVTATTFTGTMSGTDVDDDGQGGVYTSSFTNFFTCSRNTSGLTNTAVNQRKGNSSWFNKSNLLKNIKR
jgi:hypothetical protein